MSRPVSAKWPEMVGAELHLEAVGRPAERGVHHAGVVDQQVDALVPVAQRLARTADRVQRSEVEDLDVDLGARRGGPDLVCRGSAFVGVPDGKDDSGPAAGEGLGGGQTDAGVRAGDDGNAAGLIGDVVHGPACGHGGSCLECDRTI